MEFLKRYKKKITRRRDFLKKAVKGIIGGSVLTGASALIPQRALAAGGASPFIGELMIFAGNFPPGTELWYRYEQCNGQLIDISSNTALFTIIGTIYGGNGTTNFALPDLRGKISIGAGQGSGGLTERILGETGGSAVVTLQTTHLPSHNHSLTGTSSTGTSHIPSGRLLASNSEGIASYNNSSDGNLNSTALSPAGSVSPSPHNNMPQYQALNICIATQGNFPSPSGSPDIDRYIGEILLFCGNFAPAGFLPCNGQLLNIASYEELFTIIGTTYGGDGETYFRVPDLQGRVPIHSYPSYNDGETGGEETHILTANEIPYHTHALNVNSNPGTSKDPTGKFIASNVETVQQFGTGSSAVMASDAISNAGGSVAHENMPPYLVINYYIAYTGTFPSPG